MTPPPYEKPESFFDKAVKSKGTTIVGLVTLLSPFLLAIIPPEIRTGCVDTVVNSENPFTAGALATLGVLLLLLGPSIARKRI